MVDLVFDTEKYRKNKCDERVEKWIERFGGIYFELFLFGYTGVEASFIYNFCFQLGFWLCFFVSSAELGIGMY